MIDYHFRPTEERALNRVYLSSEIDALYDVLGFKDFLRFFRRMSGYSDAEIGLFEGVSRMAIEAAMRRKLKKAYPDATLPIRRKK